MDGGPTADAGAVHSKPLFKRCLFQFMDWIGNVVPQARQVCEAKIDHLDVVGCCKLQYGLRVHTPSIKKDFPCYQEYLCRS